MADFDLEQVLGSLTLDEKVSLLTGHDFWHTTPINRLGVPSIRLSDGPNGVRGPTFFDSVPAACIPCGTAIGATFDPDLVQKVGRLLGDEAKAKGAHVILGPTINILRSPLGGRGFESYSEDPLLSGVLAGAYCAGVKERGIVPTLKHFVCNDQEHERMAYDAIVTQRALREIYLLPFQIAIKASQPQAIMTAYNKSNGVHLSEDDRILKAILRDDWGWEGLLMSDWFGTYSTTRAIEAGLDLEMPGPSKWRGAALLHSILANKVKISVLDERVRAVLRLVKQTAGSGVPQNAPQKTLDRPEDREFLRRVAAESIVLLKNEESILPLSKEKKILVIGPNSKIATISGGGSASLHAYYGVTPFEGITAQASDVEFVQAIYSHQFLPLLGQFLVNTKGDPGFTFHVYNDPPEAENRELVETRHLKDANCFFLDYDHPKKNELWYGDAEGTFVPEEDGLYDFGLAVQGTAKLYVDGKLLVENFENQKIGSSFFGSGTIEEIGSVEMKAGQSYKILINWGCSKTSEIKSGGVVDFGQGGLRFGVAKRLDVVEGIKEAVEKARLAEQVILFAGLSAEWESEGQDRPTMDLPPHSDELISRVLDANANTVVVIQSGTPVTMPWIHRAKSVLQAWYGGDETGNGIADVVYGVVNPSGKLPLSMPHSIEDNPAFLNYRSEGGRTLYGEDVYIGYRYYEKVRKPPLFSFGHGLSYTTFEISDLKITGGETGEATVSVKVNNTGARDGAEVIQVYVSQTKPRINRPIKELKAFQKVFVKAGEEAMVDIKIDVVRATSFWDENVEKWCSDSSDYQIVVGNSGAADANFLRGDLSVGKTTFWTVTHAEFEESDARRTLTENLAHILYRRPEGLAYDVRNLDLTARSCFRNKLHSSQASAAAKNTTSEGGSPHILHTSRSPNTPTNNPSSPFESPVSHREYAQEATSKVQTVSQSSQYSFNVPPSLHTQGLEIWSSYPTDGLGDREVVKLILADYFQYIYPLVPVVHRPSCKRDIADNRDCNDEIFLGLIYGLCALTIATLPSKFHNYQKLRPNSPHENSKAMVYACYDEFTRLKRHEYFDEINFDKWAAHFLMYLAFFHVTDYNRSRMVEVQASQLARLLNLHKGPENNGLNYIEIQLHKKAFWLSFYTFVHGKVHFVRKERIGFIDQTEARTVRFESLMPAEVDDEYIHAHTIYPQPPGTVSLVTGFNLNSQVFLAAYTSGSQRDEPCPCIRAEDVQLQIRHLQQRLDVLKYMLDDIPAPLQPWVASEQQDNSPPPGDADDLQGRRELYGHFAILRANLHVTHLWFQTLLSSQLDVLLESQVSLEAGTLIPMCTPPLTSALPVPVRDVKLVWAEREALCRQLLHLLHGIPHTYLEPNGITIVSKIREISATLLSVPQGLDAGAERRAATYLRAFADILSKLDRAGYSGIISLQSWVDGDRI
ncbi:hypothetical protein BKA65DRAFT_547415 [Rhexocercosporidium sp. MPI-PUGE-AT-0058]|nr:hypothetical protein BKA65DRAFT_547415 [Rhexocercosporidium sp. MPI-PUGE-AT-0058]